MIDVLSQRWSKKHATILGPKEKNLKPYIISKKSPTGPTVWTPKPKYLIAPATYLGVRW